MASKTCRAGIAGRPAPGLRRYFFFAATARAGISGSTRSQNASVTFQDSTCFANVALRMPLGIRLGIEVYLIYG